MLAQPSFHRISMNVTQLLYKFRIAAHVVIVVPFLPETLCIPDQASGYTLLERFQCLSQYSLLRLARRQMNMFREFVVFSCLVRNEFALMIHN